MAEVKLSKLPEAVELYETDNMLIEQAVGPKKLTMKTFVPKLARLLDGHGGIKSILKSGEDGLVDTYTITLTDGSTVQIPITNGAKGDAPSLLTTSVQYAKSQSGTTAPETGWTSAPPAVSAGGYLWTRTTLTFDTGESTIDTCTRYGIDSTPSTEYLKDNALEHRHFLLVGDSYTEPEADGTSWPAAFAEAIGTTHYTAVPLSGHGLSNTLGARTFASGLAAYLAEHPMDCDSVTEIILEGGRNDADSDDAASGIRTGYDAFIGFCADKFPNANIRVAFCGMDVCRTELSPHRYPLLRAAMREYSRLPGYMPTSENILFDSAWMKDDGKHPTADGKRYIGHQLANIWLSGGCTNVGDAVTTAVENVNTSGAMAIREQYKDGSVTLSFVRAKITSAFDISTNPDHFFQIGNFYPRYIRPDVSDACQIPVHVVYVADGKYKMAPGIIKLASEGQYNTGASVYLSISSVNNDGNNWDSLTTPTLDIWPINPITLPQMVGV